MSRPERCEFIRSGKIAIAVMEDVSNGEIVSEGGYDEGDRGENDESKNYNAGTASCFSDSLPDRFARKKKGEQACSKRVDAQRQCEEQGKAADECHVGRTPTYFFRKLRERQPEGKGKSVPEGHLMRMGPYES